MHEGTRILMVSGGTGGHIFPALAVAEELRGRGGPRGDGYAIEFVGTRRPLESKLIPAAGFPLRTVEAAGLKGIGGIRRVRNLLVLPRTAFAVAEILREFGPQVVVGVGGYLAGPVMLEAALAGTPAVLIEPNARPGLTNRLLAPMVRVAALGFEQAAEFYGTKARVTGLPVRRAFFEIPPRRPTTCFTVLVVGGSQGSRAINQVVVKALPLLAANQKRVNQSGTAGELRIVHQTGEHDYNEVLSASPEQHLRVEVHAFIDDMAAAVAQADLVISRAGATAVAELAAAGRAALLIPFPGATDQHQLENARAVEQAGAARVILQSDLTPERLANAILELMSSPRTLDVMAGSARRLAKPGAAAAIADLVEGFVRRG